MRVQLLIFEGCPHAEPARQRLSALMRELGVAAPIEEVDLTSPQTPPALAGWASPTILVDGRDLELEAPQAQAEGGCRLYRHGSGFAGVPDEALIRSALERALGQ